MRSVDFILYPCFWIKCHLVLNVFFVVVDDVIRLCVRETTVVIYILEFKKKTALEGEM